MIITLAIRADGDWATKVSSVTKGQELVIDASYGIINQSVRASKSRYLVIIIGGNGVTTIINLISQAINEKKFNWIHLFWSVKSPEDAIYLSNLKDLAE